MGLYLNDAHTGRPVEMGEAKMSETRTATQIRIDRRTLELAQAGALGMDQTTLYPTSPLARSISRCVEAGLLDPMWDVTAEGRAELAGTEVEPAPVATAIRIEEDENGPAIEVGSLENLCDTFAEEAWVLDDLRRWMVTAEVRGARVEIELGETYGGDRDDQFAYYSTEVLADGEPVGRLTWDERWAPAS